MVIKNRNDKLILSATADHQILEYLFRIKANPRDPKANKALLPMQHQ
jgi:hypothetical protein